MFAANKVVVGLLGAALTFPYLADAKTITAACGKRQGQRLSIKAGQVVATADSDSAPITFIYRDKTPDKLLLVWTSPVSGGGGSPAAARTYEVQVLAFSETEIRAVDFEERGESFLYSLFLDRGVLYWSMHRSWNLASPGPVSVSFHASCTITREP